MKLLALRRDDRCACGTELKQGTRAGWNRRERRALCLACVDLLAYGVPGQPAAAVDPGVPGGSARARYERLRRNREASVRAAHPKIGGLLLRAFDEPQTTRAWASGAEGEERVARRLAEIGGSEVLVLHDRRTPGSRANIDHIAIGPTGVFVIDSKQYDEAKVEVRRSGGLFGPRGEQLFVRGRDKTHLVTDMAAQVAAVKRALSLDRELADAPLRAVLCFVDVYLTPRRGDTMGGVAILGPKATAKLVAGPGTLDVTTRTRLHEHLARALPAY